MAKQSLERFTDKLKEIFGISRGRALEDTIKVLKPRLTGWFNYFKLSQVKTVFDELDQWIRHRLRRILWLQWKRNYTKARNLMKLGITEENAWRTATNGRGSWYSSCTEWVNKALPKKYFGDLGLVSLFAKWNQYYSRA